MKTFPCVVRLDLEDDDNEAELLLIDTNITTRKNLDIISKAKVLKRKKDILDNKNYKNKIENSRKEAEGREDKEKIIPVFDNLQKEFDMSRGNVQRLLRLATLTPELQEKVKENRVNAKVGEQLSFLSKSNQRAVSRMMNQNEKLKISEAQSKKIKVMATDKELLKEDLEEILLKPNKVNSNAEEETANSYKIEFTEEELKDLINKLLEETKEITEENIKFKILDLLKFL